MGRIIGHLPAGEENLLSNITPSVVMLERISTSDEDDYLKSPPRIQPRTNRTGASKSGVSGSFTGEWRD